MAWTLWHFVFPAAAVLGVVFMILAFKYGMRVHASATLARLRPLPRQRLQLPGTVYCNVSIERGDYRDCFDDACFVLRDANGAELEQYGKWLRVRYNHQPPRTGSSPVSSRPTMAWSNYRSKTPCPRPKPRPGW